MTTLRSFPRATSPEAFQHLLDAIEGTTAPVAKVCLDNLSHLMCHLLSGKADVRIAPWFCGAPLTALLKKQGGIRPIAVGEVLRRLVSRLCCSHVKSSLPNVLLPYNQIGVGIRGGLEAGIHALAGIVDHCGSNPDLCCLIKDRHV